MPHMTSSAHFFIQSSNKFQRKPHPSSAKIYTIKIVIFFFFFFFFFDLGFTALSRIFHLYRADPRGSHFYPRAVV